MSKSENRNWKRMLWIGLIVVFVLSMTDILFAKSEKASLLKIEMTFEEAIAADNLLKRITLKGDEVIPFMDIYRPLQNAIQQAEKKKPNDNIYIEMSPEAANNLIAFLQRTTLTGAEAIQLESILMKTVKSVTKKK